VKAQGEESAYRLVRHVYCIYPHHNKAAFQAWSEAKRTEMAMLSRERDRNRICRIPIEANHAYDIYVDAEIQLASWSDRYWRMTHLQQSPPSDLYESNGLPMDPLCDVSLLTYWERSDRNSAFTNPTSGDLDRTECSVASKNPETVYAQTGCYDSAVQSSAQTIGLLYPSATGQTGDLVASSSDGLSNDQMCSGASIVCSTTYNLKR
jgi:hypothetical protein